MFNRQPSNLGGRHRKVLISEGRDNPPSRRRAGHRRLAYAIAAVAVVALVFEFVVILLSRR
jgi:hypothetical protein